MPLTFEEELRYSRHLVLPGIGVGGQERLKRARVLLVGAGGLGAPVALYLTAAGVGTLGIMDDDVVEVSNLQRQVLHRTANAGRAKVDSAADMLAALNPLTQVIPLRARAGTENACDIIADYDVVVDGTDNFASRYLLNDACALMGKPLVFGSIFRFEGQVAVFDAHRGPCYRCLFPDPPPPSAVPTCAEGGVLGVLPGLIGMIQATETLKLLLDIGEVLLGRLLLLDALTMRFREVRISKNPDCPLCGESPTIDHLTAADEYCGLTPSNADSGEWEIAPEQLGGLFADQPVRWVDVREEWECDATPGIPGALHIPYPTFSRRMADSTPRRTFSSTARRVFAVGTRPVCCVAPVLRVPGA